MQDLLVDGSIEQLSDPDKVGFIFDSFNFGVHQARVNHIDNTNHVMIDFEIIAKTK